jgi:hypothetical protein
MQWPLPKSVETPASKSLDYLQYTPRIQRCQAICHSSVNLSPKVFDDCVTFRLSP